MTYKPCWRAPGARRLVAVPAAALIACLTAAACTKSPDYRTFATPEEAVRVLTETVKAGSLPELVKLFGSEGRDLVSSSDPATGQKNREVFLVAIAEQWHLVDRGANAKELVIGNEDWPFPIPLVKDGTKWRFDTAAGAEEVLARRIGRNELAIIRVCETYATAQRAYAARSHDGRPAGLYAQRFRSDAGTENGLYWPTKHGVPRSPLGDLVAEAAEEGRRPGQGGEPAPFHGYYFRILQGQGAAAPGGPADYVVNGEMSAGYALLAWPAQYDASGVMTFIINRDGIVHEKDLGPETSMKAKAITRYDPDETWHRAQPEPAHTP